MKTVRAVLISAMASGEGKTTVTAALARRLVREGKTVRVFKTGPDFLDPMMLAQASGAPVYNLDLWLVGESECRRLLADAAQEADAILIEGVMGLYDGQPSSADLARAFGVPVLAVIDASAMAQTAGAVVQGLRDYGPVQLAGVVANRVAGQGHANMVRDALHDVPLLGSLSRQARALPERHLGLVQPGEIGEADAILTALADAIELDQAAWEAMPPVDFADAVTQPRHERPLQGRRIAIARDAAFSFVYPANIDTLAALGATLQFFSPVANEPVPPNADAVYLPGGYPELHAAALAAADRWHASVRAAHAADKPILAECGGMMALADSLTDVQGATHAMSGLVPGRVILQSRLAAIGSQAWDTASGELRGHAFHFSRIETSLKPTARTRRYPGGAEGEAVYRIGSLTASYFHAYFPSCPAAVAALFSGAEPR
ncbi:cobyrinate a,c-diamide synthase [Oxalobacteraceae bacterium OM1]|nr:cobyrinate a,c-diamide synthase [Oxalobacteraceae bacterium OM1]